MVREQRSNYKGVWNNLSTTYRAATTHVIGDVDEVAIKEAATHTLYWLEQTVGVRPDDTILEIGCGIGRVGEILAPRCQKWIGCDVSANMLQHADQRLASFSNVQLVEISGYDLQPIPDASVDVVYSTVVFMHLDEWERYNYIKEAARILKPNGRIFVDNFNLRAPEGWDIFLTHWRVPPPQRPAHISKASTPQELEVYLQRAEFADIQVHENGAWVQAYARRPEVVSEVGGIHYTTANLASAPDPHIATLEQELARLHRVVAEKNTHIRRLEHLLNQIQHGRVLRLLQWLQRKR